MVRKINRIPNRMRIFTKSPKRTISKAHNQTCQIATLRWPKQRLPRGTPPSSSVWFAIWHTGASSATLIRCLSTSTTWNSCSFRSLRFSKNTKADTRANEFSLPLSCLWLFSRSESKWNSFSRGRTRSFSVRSSMIRSLRSSSMTLSQSLLIPIFTTLGSAFSSLDVRLLTSNMR